MDAKKAENVDEDDEICVFDDGKSNSCPRCQRIFVRPAKLRQHIKFNRLNKFNLSL